jgi:hypothetical protein
MINLSKKEQKLISQRNQIEEKVRQTFDSKFYESKLLPFFKKYQFRKESENSEEVEYFKVMRTLKNEYIFSICLYPNNVHISFRAFYFTGYSFEHRGSSDISESILYKDIESILKNIDKMRVILDDKLKENIL